MRRRVFLVGADEFADFLGWKEPDGILEHVRLGVATRPGYPHERLDAVLAALRRPERVKLFEIPSVDVSSTEIRRARGTRRAGSAISCPGGRRRGWSSSMLTVYEAATLRVLTQEKPGP